MDFKTRLEFQGIALHGRRISRVLQDFDVLIDGGHLLVHGSHESFQVWHNLSAIRFVLIYFQRVYIYIASMQNNTSVNSISIL